MQELYEWYCPLCGKYHYKRISFWDTGKCEGCYNDFFVDKNGEIRIIRERKLG